MREGGSEESLVQGEGTANAKANVIEHRKRI